MDASAGSVRPHPRERVELAPGQALPLVSCLVATDNHARFLPAALESALAQDYPAERLEVVVVDDGSTDDTDVAICPFLDRVRYVRKAHGELNSAINRALAEARGDLIALLSADDEWPPDRVSRQVELLLARPEVGLVYGDLEVIDAAGQVVQPSFWKAEGIAPRRGRVLGELLKHNFVSGGGLMVRASLAEAFAPIPPEIPCNDWWIAARVAEVAEIDYLEGAPVHRLRGSSMKLGVPAERRGALYRAELPLRRHLLRHSLDTVDPVDALEALRLFEQGVGLAAQAFDGAPEELVPVTDEDRACAADAHDAGLSAWRDGDGNTAAQRLVQALACDPRDDVARSLLGALMRGFEWPQTPASTAVVERPAVSIVIPVHGKLQLTRQCLRALALTAPSAPYEVIVVDDASPDGTADFLRAEEAAGHLRAIVNAENAGFARACNQGLALAAGEHVLFLDNDTIALPGWLDAMLASLDAAADVGVVGSRLLYPDWTIQHAGILFSERSEPYHVSRGAPFDHPAVSASADFPAVTGACMLVRGSLARELGGFSEAYRMYVEDIDLCFAAWHAGYRVCYCAGSVLLHLESASAPGTTGRDEQVREGWATLHERWAGRLPLRVAGLCGSAFGPVRLRRRLNGARRLVGLAFAEELVEHPELLVAYAGVVSGAEDVTLVVSTAGSVDRLAALVEELGLGGDEAADLLAVGPETAVEELALLVDFVLSTASPEGPLEALPSYDESTVGELRLLLVVRGLTASALGSKSGSHADDYPDVGRPSGTTAPADGAAVPDPRERLARTGSVQTQAEPAA